jgi:hypothetical protein
MTLDGTILDGFEPSDTPREAVAEERIGMMPAGPTNHG